MEMMPPPGMGGGMPPGMGMPPPGMGGGPPPIPGVSDPAAMPKDRMTQLAELLGQTKADDTATAMQKMTDALKLMEEASSMDARLQPIVSQIMSVLNQSAAPPSPPQAGGIMGPQPPGVGMAQPPMV
jgi:hypothetical protein